MADPKETWHVVKFIIAATGFKRREARQLLEEIPRDKYSELFLRARAWDRDAATKAGEQLAEIVGTKQMPTLAGATDRARYPSTHTGEEDDDEEPMPERPKRKKKS